MERECTPTHRAGYVDCWLLVGQSIYLNLLASQLLFRVTLMAFPLTLQPSQDPTDLCETTSSMHYVEKVTEGTWPLHFNVPGC